MVSPAGRWAVVAALAVAALWPGAVMACGDDDAAPTTATGAALEVRAGDLAIAVPAVLAKGDFALAQASGATGCLCNGAIEASGSWGTGEAESFAAGSSGGGVRVLSVDVSKDPDIAALHDEPRLPDTVARLAAARLALPLGRGAEGYELDAVEPGGLAAVHFIARDVAAADGTEVAREDWLFYRPAASSLVLVTCQYDSAKQASVQSACAAAVGSVRVAG